jgi:hypothetical protein
VPPAPPPKPAFDAKPHIAAIEEPLLTSIDNVARQANKLLPTLSRRCPHEIRLVNERLAEIEALRTAAESLDKSLSTLQEDLEAKLIAAGSSGPDAHIISFRWAHEQFKDTPRHFGAQSLTRLCEKARAEHEFLRDNIAKWTIDSKGELKSKDTAFKQQADSNHFFVKAEADRRDSITNQLRGQ